MGLKKLQAATSMEAGKETSGQSSGGIKREEHTMAAKVQYSCGMYYNEVLNH